MSYINIAILKHYLKMFAALIYTNCDCEANWQILPMECHVIRFMFNSVLYVTVQIRVGGLPPISKHREELKLQGKAEHF